MVRKWEERRAHKLPLDCLASAQGRDVPGPLQGELSVGPSGPPLAQLTPLSPMSWEGVWEGRASVDPLLMGTSQVSAAEESSRGLLCASALLGTSPVVR